MTFKALMSTFAVVLTIQYGLANTINGYTTLQNTQLEDTTINGGANLKDITAISLSIYGSLTFRDLKIARAIEVNGSVTGDTLSCSSFRINGSFNGNNIKASEGSVSGSFTGKNITIEGKAKIEGNLSVSDSNFQDIVIKIVDKSLLENSTAANIKVGADSERPQRLILKGQTIITGDIIFESGTGEVHLDPTVVVKGQITGARIIRQ